MSDEKPETFTLDGTEYEVGDEFEVVGEFPHHDKGVQIRVDELYTVEGDTFVVISSTGIGPDTMDFPLARMEETVEALRPL